MSACDGEDPEPLTEAEDAALRERLVEASWRLVRAEEAGQDAREPGAEAGEPPWVRFASEPAEAEPPEPGRTELRDPDRRRLEGHGGCNGFSGAYRLLPDGELAVRDLVSTEIFCTPPEVMEVESAFLFSLSTATSYRFEGDTLVLASERGTAQLVPGGGRARPED